MYLGKRLTGGGKKISAVCEEEGDLGVRGGNQKKRKAGGGFVRSWIQKAKKRQKTMTRGGHRENMEGEGPPT